MDLKIAAIQFALVGVLQAFQINMDYSDYLRKNMNGIIHLLVLKLYFNWVVLLFNWAWNNTNVWGKVFKSILRTYWFQTHINSICYYWRAHCKCYEFSFAAFLYFTVWRKNKTGAGYPGFVGLYFVISNTDFGSRKGIFG